ncbi:MAG: hypothetical protein ACYST6_11140 [Planctomycetota bacterium]|jgi:hypothetical protein
MAEENDDSRTTKPRISRLGIASLILAVLAVLTMVLASSIVYPRDLSARTLNTAALLAGLSFILAVVALILILKSEPRTKGLVFTLAALLMAGLVADCWLIEQRPRSIILRLPCRTNLMALGSAMLVYSAYNDDDYPAAEKWCDLLVQHTKVTPKQFVCPSIVVRLPFTRGKTIQRPGPKTGRCSYAMNPNCVDMSPPDTVLLFETDAGWNQFGGPELVSTKAHGGKGFNVLHRQGRVFFEQDANNLNWSGTKDNK